MAFLLLGLVVLIGGLFYVAFMFYKVLKRKYIPYVPIIPSNSIFGFTRIIFCKNGDSHHRFLEFLDQHGPIVQYNIFGTHRIALMDAKIAKEVLKRVTTKIPSLTLKGTNDRGNRAMVSPNIFTLATGSDWQKRRSTFKHSFSFSSLRSFDETLTKIVSKTLTTFEEHALSGKPLAVDRLFCAMTMDVICQVAFNYDLGSMHDSPLFDQLHDSLRTFVELFWVNAIINLPFMYDIVNLPLGISSFESYKKCLSSLNEFNAKLYDNLIESKKNGTLSSNSFGQAILDFSEMEGVTRDQVLAEIGIMFIAGHETTAHTLSFLVYSLASYPQIQEMCHQSADQWVRQQGVGGVGVGVGSPASLPPYLEAFLKESMRKYPVAGNGSVRQVTDKGGLEVDVSHLSSFLSDPTVKKITIPQGTIITTNFFGLHNSKYNWGEDVKEFKPERWLSGYMHSSPLSSVYNNSTSSTSSSTSSTSSSTSSFSAQSSSQTNNNTNNNNNNNNSTNNNKESIELLDCDGSQFDHSLSNPLTSPAVFAGGGMNPNELAFSPFSFGPRNCIGMNLSLIELRLTLLELVKRFSFEFVDPRMKDESYALETRLTLRPKDKLPILVKLRKDNGIQQQQQ